MQICLLNSKTGQRYLSSDVDHELLTFTMLYWTYLSPMLQVILSSNEANPHLDLLIMGIELIVVVIYCTTIQSLHGLSYFSLIANFLNFAGLIFVLFYVVQDSPPQSERPAFVGWFDLPMYFGTAVYAFEGIGLVRRVCFPLRHTCKLVFDIETRFKQPICTQVVEQIQPAEITFGFMLQRF